MIDFSQIETAVKVDVKFILSKLDEVQIFYYYFGHFELGKVYSSKFRKDATPSTGFYFNKRGRLVYNDLKTGEKLDCIAFVAKLHNMTFGEACYRIATDFGLIKHKDAKPMAQSILNKTIDFDREAKRSTEIQITPGRWESHHINYWKQYEIDVADLKREEVYPVKKLFINKAEFFGLDELTFAYAVKERIGKEEKVYLKIYQPYKQGATGKWISNVPITVPFGMHNLKYGTDHVIVGKAQKDRLILLKLFESVIGTQNESESALQRNLVNHLCFQFPRRTIIWDSDETGVTNCTKFNDKGFGYFNTPKHLLEHGIKDVSDYVKEFGLAQLERLLKHKGIL